MPSLKMCAIFRTLSFNYPLFNLKSNYDLWLKTEKRQKCGRNVAFSPRIGHFGRESATVGKKNGNPSLSSDSRNFGKKMVGIERFELSTF